MVERKREEMAARWADDAPAGPINNTAELLAKQRGRVGRRRAERAKFAAALRPPSPQLSAASEPSSEDEPAAAAQTASHVPAQSPRNGSRQQLPAATPVAVLPRYGGSELALVPPAVGSARGPTRASAASVSSSPTSTPRRSQSPATVAADPAVPMCLPKPILVLDLDHTLLHGTPCRLHALPPCAGMHTLTAPCRALAQPPQTRACDLCTARPAACLRKQRRISCTLPSRNAWWRWMPRLFRQLARWTWRFPAPLRPPTMLRQTARLHPPQAAHPEPPALQRTGRCRTKASGATGRLKTCRQCRPRACSALPWLVTCVLLGQGAW